MTVNVKWKAHYPLYEVKMLVRERAVIISSDNAYRPAVRMGFSKESIFDCILELKNGNFKKSTEDWYHKGLWQDAYCIHFEGQDIYIKLQIKEFEGKKVILTSFHENNQEEFYNAIHRLSLLRSKKFGNQKINEPRI
ncbi:MAG: type II toxin-antitoxin system MqsR family toxin [Desulfoplanes sp.]|nr:type II toxin-antitoxin system MqsR family toxin [Desulfoplanes sp.]